MNTKLFVATLLSPLLFSCHGNSKDENNADSAIVIEDTFQGDKEEGKVIADLNFFISSEDYHKNVEKYLSSIPKSTIGDYLLGRYEVFGIHPRFENDSLYYFQLEGSPITHEYYNNVLRGQYMDLLDTYTKKYGKPSFLRESFPKSYNLEERAPVEMARWDLGKRTISIKVKQDSPYYHLNLEIFRNDVLRRVKSRDDKKDIESKEKAMNAI